MKTILSLSLLFSMNMAMATTPKVEKTYMCSASFIERVWVSHSLGHGENATNLNTRVVSAIAVDYDGTIGGGGSGGFGERQYKEGKDVISEENQLKDAQGKTISTAASYSNDDENKEYDIEVSFFRGHGKNSKELGEIKIKGEGTKTLVISDRDMIVVSCYFAPKVKTEK